MDNFSLALLKVKTRASDTTDHHTILPPKTVTEFTFIFSKRKNVDTFLGKNSPNVNDLRRLPNFLKHACNHFQNAF